MIIKQKKDFELKKSLFKTFPDKFPELIEIEVPICEKCKNKEKNNKNYFLFLSLALWLMVNFLIYINILKEEIIFSFFPVISYIIFKIITIISYLLNKKINKYYLIENKIKEWWKNGWIEKIKRIIKPGILWTINWFWVSIYKETTYLVFFFLPIIPLSSWNLDDLWWGEYIFYSEKKMNIYIKIWRYSIFLYIIIFFTRIVLSN